MRTRFLALAAFSLASAPALADCDLTVDVTEGDSTELRRTTSTVPLTKTSAMGKRDRKVEVTAFLEHDAVMLSFDAGQRGRGPLLTESDGSRIPAHVVLEMDDGNKAVLPSLGFGDDKGAERFAITARLQPLLNSRNVVGVIYRGSRHHFEASVPVENGHVVGDLLRCVAPELGTQTRYARH